MICWCQTCTHYSDDAILTNMQTHLCVWLSLLEDASQPMHSPVCGASPIALSSTHSLLRVHSSTCFPPQLAHALSDVACALVCSLRHSLQLFMSQLKCTGFSPSLALFFSSCLCTIRSSACHNFCVLPTVQLTVAEAPAHTMNHWWISVCFQLWLASAEARPQTVSGGGQGRAEQSRGGQHCWTPTENRTSWPDFK